MQHEIDKKIEQLQDYVAKVPAGEIEFMCNDCLTKNGLPLPPTWYYHDTGCCQNCKKVNDVSVPCLNKKAADLGIVIDVNLKYKGNSGRNVLWSDRIYDLKHQRFNPVPQND